MAVAVAESRDEAEEAAVTGFASADAGAAGAIDGARCGRATPLAAPRMPKGPRTACASKFYKWTELIGHVVSS